MAVTPITLTDGTTTVDLNVDLYWSDELDWQPVAMSQERSITGAVLAQTQARVSGRPITLQPEDDESGATPLSDVAQLRVWAAIPGKVLSLTIRGGTRNVIFRHDDGALSATPWIHYSDVLTTDPYFCVMRFQEKD